VSFVLLWQPSGCIGLFVIDYIFVLFSENKYDDDDLKKKNDRNEISAADGAEDLIDGNAGRDGAVEDVELSLESLRNIVASSSRVNHGANHLYVHDVCELSRLLQIVETRHLHQLTCQLVRYLPLITVSLVYELHKSKAFIVKLIFCTVYLQGSPHVRDRSCNCIVDKCYEVGILCRNFTLVC